MAPAVGDPGQHCLRVYFQMNEDSRAPEDLEIARTQQRAHADGDHRLGAGRHLLQHRRFYVAEARFALRSKYLPNTQTGPLLDEAVGIDEWQAQAAGGFAPNSCFA